MSSATVGQCHDGDSWVHLLSVGTGSTHSSSVVMGFLPECPLPLLEAAPRTAAEYEERLAGEGTPLAPGVVQGVGAGVDAVDGAWWTCA